MTNSNPNNDENKPGFSVVNETFLEKLDRLSDELIDKWHNIQKRMLDWFIIQTPIVKVLSATAFMVGIMAIIVIAHAIADGGSSAGKGPGAIGTAKTMPANASVKRVDDLNGPWVAYRIGRDNQLIYQTGTRFFDFSSEYRSHYRYCSREETFVDACVPMAKLSLLDAGSDYLLFATSKQDQAIDVTTQAIRVTFLDKHTIIVTEEGTEDGVIGREIFPMYFERQR